MKKYILLFLFIVFAIIFNSVKAQDFLYDKCIYIDPGHGGVDPGAFYGGVKEKDINLEIAYQLKRKLDENNVITYMTRDADYDLAKTKNGRKKSDLYERSKLINDSNCDLYISLHLNAYYQTRWSGPQVFYSKVNKENIILAELITNSLKKEIKETRNFASVKGYLYDRVRIPGILIEVGFLSNPYEREKLKSDDYQGKIAEIISKGILEYFAKYY